MEDHLVGLDKSIRDRLPDPEPEKPRNGYRYRVAQPYVSPKAQGKVAEAIKNSTISSGSAVVGELESQLMEYFSVPFAKACSNGYSALLIALKLARIKKGDEVIIPSFTMVAVANAVLAVGATPVFVDCEEGGTNPSPNQYEEKLTSLTRALIITHIYGVPGDSESLVTLCEKYNVAMIEDIAEAIGVEINGKKAGTFGDYACASLYANKVITSGDGGFVISKHSDVASTSRAKSYVNHGFCDGYHFVHFEHSGNYKMSGLQAAFVIPAVQDIPVIARDRSRISETYQKYLKNEKSLKFLPKNKFGNDTPWMFGVLVETKKKRTEVRQKLAYKGIETRDFFFPMHLQPLIVCNGFGKITGSFSNAEYLGDHGFYLPTYYGLEEEDIQYICGCLIDSLH